MKENKQRTINELIRSAQERLELSQMKEKDLEIARENLAKAEQKIAEFLEEEE